MTIGGPDGMPRVVHEARSRRRLIRVRMPLEVTVTGRRFQARDLSLGGFSVADSDPSWSVGRHVRAVLTFPVERLRVQFETDCEVVRADAAGLTGFRFCDLSPDQLDFLRQVMNAFVTGRVVAVGAVLAVAGGPEVGWSAPADHAHQASIGATLRRLAGYALLLATGAGLASVAALSIYARVLTVRSELAAMSHPVVTIAATRDGIVAGPLPSAGDTVANNAALLDLRSDQLEADIRIAQAAVERQGAVVASLYRRHHAALGFMSVYAGLADAALAEAHAGLGGARAELDAATRHAERTGTLRMGGFAADASLEAAMLRKAAAMSAVEGAEAGIAAARVNRDMASAGRLFTGSRIEGHEPEVIAEELAVAEAERRFLERKLAALLDQRAFLTLTSPCDCVIQAVLRRSGEWVAAGTPLLQLTPAAGGGTVVAKIPLDQAGYLRRGGAAEILLADRAPVLAGRIVDIRLTPPAAPRIGLPAPIDQDPRFASVEVFLEGRIFAAAGTPAQAVFPIAPQAALFRWWGGAAAGSPAQPTR